MKNEILEIEIDERCLDVEVEIKYSTAYDASENVEIEDYRIVSCVDTVTQEDVKVTPEIEEKVMEEMGML
jgi:hypothetical protein